MRRQSLSSKEKSQIALLLRMRNKHLEERLKIDTTDAHQNLEWFRVEATADRAEIKVNARIISKMETPSRS